MQYAGFLGLEPGVSLFPALKLSNSKYHIPKMVPVSVRPLVNLELCSLHIPNPRKRTECVYGTHRAAHW